MNHNVVRLSDRSTSARTVDGKSVRSQYFGHSSFAKMSEVNEKCIVKCEYPDKMDIYAPIGCGFHTGAGTVLNVLKPGKGDSIVVFDLGSVGLTPLMAAKYMGAGQIIAVDIVNEKLKMGKELGATHTINSREKSDVVKTFKEVRKGVATYAIDCTGLLRIIEDMVECLAPQGTAALVGVPPADKKIQLDSFMFLLDNRKLVGVIDGDSNPTEFIPKLVEMQRRGDFPIERLCRTYPVERLKDAIHDLHSGKVSRRLKFCAVEALTVPLGHQASNTVELGEVFLNDILVHVSYPPFYSYISMLPQSQIFHSLLVQYYILTQSPFPIHTCHDQQVVWVQKSHTRPICLILKHGELVAPRLSSIGTCHDLSGAICISTV